VRKKRGRESFSAEAGEKIPDPFSLRLSELAKPSAFHDSYGFVVNFLPDCGARGLIVICHVHDEHVVVLVVATLDANTVYARET
jgi:hypothetical protein